MVHTMNLAQYLEMWNRIGKWQEREKTTRIPNYVNVADMNVGVEKVTYAQLIDMLNRMKKWQDNHNGAMAQVIGIENAATGTEPRKVGNVRAKLEANLGKFNSITEFWQKILGRGYKYYYNDIYTLDQEISRLVNKQGLNCTDSMQLLHALATEMGYQCRYVHVQCKEGGHIRGQINGKEFNGWTRVDPAAALSVGSKYPIGRVWCDYSNAHVEDGTWVKVDDAQ